MKKRILALAVMCMMLLATVNVYAAAGTVYFDLGENIEVTDRTGTITVPVNMSFSDDIAIVDGTNGIGSFQIHIVYDSSVLTFAGIEGTEYENFRGDYTEDMVLDEDILVTAVNQEAAVAGSATLKRVSAIVNGLSARKSFYNEGTILNANFTVATDKQTETTETITNIYYSEDVAAACKAYYTDDEAVTVSVTGGDVDVTLKGTAPIVTETKVKTFEKRALVNGTDLVTVGIISKGTNYAEETVKAGIEIAKGEGTVKYWFDGTLVNSDDLTKAYYMIGLTGVDAVGSKITKDSGSRAIITVNGGAIQSDDTELIKAYDVVE